MLTNRFCGGNRAGKRRGLSEKLGARGANRASLVPGDIKEMTTEEGARHVYHLYHHRNYCGPGIALDLRGYESRALHHRPSCGRIESPRRINGSVLEE